MLSSGRWISLQPSHRRLIMWGASDQARVNYHILKHLGFTIEALIDDTVGKSSPFINIPLYVGERGLDVFLKTVNTADMGFVIAIGNPFGDVRLKLHEVLMSKGLLPISFIDQTALVCKSVSHGDGLQVMPAALVHNEVQIGTQCIINTKALVEHDCVLGDGVEVGPGAVLCGRVTLGKNTWVGANATVKPRVTIGDNTIIGAGAVVLQDIPSNVVAAGVPAKVISLRRS